MSDQDLPVGDESPTVAYVDNSEDRKWTIRSTVSQVLATMAKNVIIFACGLSLGFPTIVIPSVYNPPPDATLRLTQEEVSWFGSINYVAIPLGSIVSGTLSHRFGRKRTMQCLCIPLFVSWVLFYVADSALVLCAGVALGGFVGGLLEAPILTYISEISEPRLRGILSASAPLSSIFGTFMLYFLGSFIDWRTLGAICATAPILGFTVMFFIPESPHWLIGKNRIEETRKALCWLRGWTTKERIQEEYDHLVSQVNREVKTAEVDEQQKERFCFSSFDVKNYLQRTFVAPFALIMLTFAASHFTGITTLSTFSVNIFNSFGAPIDGYYATVMLGLARFSGTIACMSLIHYVGKRVLTFVSGTVLMILFGGVGLYGYFYLELEKMDNGVHVEEKFHGVPSYSWFPMLCFIGGSFFGYLGIRVMPWTLVGEVYPTDIRGSASGVSAGLGYLMGFVANKTFFDAMAAFTLPGVFLFYAVVAFVCVIAFYFWLPETEGWTLVEVQEHFAGYRSLIKTGIRKKDLKGQENSVSVEDEVTKV